MPKNVQGLIAEEARAIQRYQPVNRLSDAEREAQAAARARIEDAATAATKNAQRATAHPVRGPPRPSADQLLLTRRQAAHLLGVSTATIINWQLAGRLKAIKPSGKRAGLVLYAHAEVRALAEGGAAA